MHTIHRRLRRLEERFTPRKGEGRCLVELLQARERRWAEARGEAYVPPPPQKDLAGLTLTEIFPYISFHDGRSSARGWHVRGLVPSVGAVVPNVVSELV
jgi:hypothetical protein